MLVEVAGLFAGCGTTICQIWASALRTGQTGPGSSRTCLQMSSKRSAVIRWKHKFWRLNGGALPVPSCSSQCCCLCMMVAFSVQNLVGLPAQLCLCGFLGV